VKRLEEWFGLKMGWLGCTHHILELIVGKLFKSIFGKTTSPEDPFCKRFKDWWNNSEITTTSVKKLPGGFQDQVDNKLH
jgi:hypothetical protein